MLNFAPSVESYRLFYLVTTSSISLSNSWATAPARSVEQWGYSTCIWRACRMEVSVAVPFWCSIFKQQGAFENELTVHSRYATAQAWCNDWFVGRDRTKPPRLVARWHSQSLPIDG